MTGELAPLCDQHHAPMYRSGTIPLAFDGCIGDSICQRRYHPMVGYYAGVNLTKTREVYCVAHGFRPLFVCAYDPTRRLTQYACPVPGCEITEWLPPIAATCS